MMSQQLCTSLDIILNDEKYSDHRLRSYNALSGIRCSQTTSGMLKIGTLVYRPSTEEYKKQITNCDRVSTYQSFTQKCDRLNSGPSGKREGTQCIS